MRDPGYERALAIDADGSFLVALRNDHVAGVYRSFDGATGWTRIGRTLGQVEFVGVRAVNGTYLIEARGTNEVFVPEELWTVPAPAGEEPELAGTTLQVVRPDTKVSEVLAAEHVAISEDGHCVAHSDGKEITVLNMRTGIAWSLGTAASFDRFVWIE